MDSVVHRLIELQPREREPVDAVASRHLVAILALALCTAGPVRAQSDAVSPSMTNANGPEEIPPELGLPGAPPESAEVLDGSMTVPDTGELTFGPIDAD